MSTIRRGSASLIGTWTGDVAARSSARRRSAQSASRATGRSTLRRFARRAPLAAPALLDMIEPPGVCARAGATGRLSSIHGDPVERLLIAQAQIETLPPATNGRRIRRYGVATV